LDTQAVRGIVLLGIIAACGMALVMAFSLDQIADTQAPAIAADIAQNLARALATAPPAPVKLTMTRDGPGADAPRIYKLVLRPNAIVAGDERSLSRLMFKAAQMCAEQVEGAKGPVTIRCIAELPGGGTKEAAFAKSTDADVAHVDVIRPVTVAAAPPTPGGEKR
jgi:hypothetical protein